jgi:hypothetical protein
MAGLEKRYRSKGDDTAPTENVEEAKFRRFPSSPLRQRVAHQFNKGNPAILVKWASRAASGSWYSIASAAIQMSFSGIGVPARASCAHKRP